MTPASRLRPPAYSKALLEKRRAGLSPSNSLCIALDWSIGKCYAWRVVVPPDKDVSAVDFSLAAGLEVMLRGQDQSRMDCVARELLKLPLHRLVGVSDRITVYWPAAE